MDKSNHTITVPREYLEMLENFFNKNSGEGNNSKLMIRNTGLGQRVFLETEVIPDYVFRDIDALYVIDKDGVEQAVFRKL
jgi:hypothetical protein